MTGSGTLPALWLPRCGDVHLRRARSAACSFHVGHSNFLRSVPPTRAATGKEHVADPAPHLMRGVKKSNLPKKPCATCGRFLVWRKKWERNRAEVRHCSDRCRQRSRRLRPAQYHA